MIAPTLTTDRLILRPYALLDFDDFADLMLSTDSQYMGGPLEDLDEAWGAFCSDIASWGLLGFGYWAVEETATGALVGAVGLGKPPSFPERELGWHLYAAYRGKGFATEAAVAARDYALNTRGWDTLVSYVHPENYASQAVAKRLGATLDPEARRTDPEDLVFRHPKVPA